MRNSRVKSTLPLKNSKVLDRGVTDVKWHSPINTINRYLLVIQDAVCLIQNCANYDQDDESILYITKSQEMPKR
jgi:hypothetical protein